MSVGFFKNSYVTFRIGSSDFVFNIPGLHSSLRSWMYFCKVEARDETATLEWMTCHWRMKIQTGHTDDFLENLKTIYSSVSAEYAGNSPCWPCRSCRLENRKNQRSVEVMRIPLSPKEEVLLQFTTLRNTLTNRLPSYILYYKPHHTKTQGRYVTP